MKQSLTISTVLACILILFPFIGLPEFWEYLFVVIPAALIAFLNLDSLKKYENIIPDKEEDSLSEYVKKLRQRFKDEKKSSSDTKKLIDDIQEDVRIERDQ